MGGPHSGRRDRPASRCVDQGHIGDARRYLGNEGPAGITQVDKGAQGPRRAGKADLTEHPTIASDDLLSRLIFAHAEENPNDDDVVQHSWDTARAVLGSLESGEFPEALAAAPNALAEWETIASEPHKWPELASRLLIAMMGRQDGGLFTTPASLTRLMSACVQAIYARRKPSQVNVLDFACGTGSLLLEVCTTLADCGHEVVAYGCDVNESAVETARAALQRTGIANQVRVGNILQESPFDPESIDLVVVDPPASVRLTQEERATLRGLLGEFRGSSGSHAFAARAMQMGMINAGLHEDIMTVLEAMPGLLVLMLPSLLSIIGLLLLGIGLLWKGGIPRWAAGLLIVGAVLFFVGVNGGAEFTEKSLTLLSHLAFLIALAPIGLRYLAGDSQAYEFDMATV